MSKRPDTLSVLFVCMGNICRSPTAHGVFRQKVEDAGLSDLIYVESAGTHAYHVGEPPDPRSQATALMHGYDLSDLRARKIEVSDFQDCDYILVMDEDNLTHSLGVCPAGSEKRVQLFLDFAQGRHETEVPDPYYGGEQGFNHVLQLIEAASDGLIRHIRQSTV